MADLPVRPHAGITPLPPGWTEHKAPSGHTYYYNRDTGKSTYTRPVAEVQSFQPSQPAFSAPTPASPYAYNTTNPNFTPTDPFPGTTFPGAPDAQHTNVHIGNQQHSRGGHRGTHRGAFTQPHNRQRQPEDRPKHRHDIPNCAPWVLVRTKLGRRFVWNKETNESFWKFPPNVMKAVIEYDRQEREKRERRARGEPSEDEEDAAMEEETTSQPAAADQPTNAADDDSEYEEVEVTDDEDDDTHPSKRARTTSPSAQPTSPQPLEMDEDDMAWQLAELEALEGEDEEEEGLPLTEADCKALFRELLTDLSISPYTPWETVLTNTPLYDDARYKALPTMRARKQCFDDWCRDRIIHLREQKALQSKRDPRIPYLAFLHTHATPRLYWPEFRRKFKREAEMRDTKVNEKEKEKLYRELVKRLALSQAQLKSELSALLKEQPLATLNASTTLDTLPDAVLTDLRFISLPASIRDSLVETYISTLPAAPEDAATSAEEQEVARKQKAERERREKALAERERRVREEKRRQERDLAYGKGRLREEEDEIEQAMRVGKQGLRGQLEGTRC
ncbi:hypothetical protein M011DRAFT_460214 [Sporormia fimetaria CBS 119925]|uniref:WW domain-containing protein n=1 Tax=Sporormia fimetaria CBS 119925 TaxID=1340428 RepID=A0A6A6V6I4_9PLEO|nr:hypothetical protein M011DRAFT_460214 [Sporormia fimetaria CBS 119925]